MPGPLSEELFRFLELHIDSVYELELLLFLHRRRGLQWTPAAIGHELQLSPDFVGAALRRLRERELVECDDGSFRLRASDGDLTRLIDRLAEAYVEYRVRIIAFIYSRQSRGRQDPIRSFAEAFRLTNAGKKDSESGPASED
jgi:hypothetical protein